MRSGDPVARAHIRTALGFNCGPNGVGNASPDSEKDYDEIVVVQIVTALSQRQLRTMGEFGMLVRPYLGAGYEREVNEAHRQYFDHSFQI